MSNFTNGLSDAELERLALLAEELGESLQVIGKIIRHGYDSCHPERNCTNRDELEYELGHVIAAVEMMEKSNDVEIAHVDLNRISKLSRVNAYMHHQQELKELGVING